jgi:AcrR family transcriptional regulator
MLFKNRSTALNVDQDTVVGVPRNRLPRDRVEKRDEIVSSATALFTDSGYDQASMTRVAHHAGVTPTTIYWYFPDKDAVLVAVVSRVLQTVLDRYLELEPSPLDERILWVVDQLQSYHRLVDAVHTRSAFSTEVDEWHNGFHATVGELQEKALAEAGVPEDELAPVSQILTLVIESLLTHPRTDDERRVIVDLLLRKLCAQ